MAEITIKIEGMSCGGCVHNVTNALEALPGVAAAEVSLESAVATVRYDPATTEVAAMRRAIEAAGFDAPE
jgi:copper chaperone